MQQHSIVDAAETSANSSSTQSPAAPDLSVAQASPVRNRLHYIDGLRAIAALVVIFNHVYQHIWWQQMPLGFMYRLAPWFSLGHFSVVAFIVLSGFCLMRPVLLTGGLRGGVREFYKGRALRILPAYWAALLFSLLLIYTLIGQKHNIMFDISLPVTKEGLLGHALLVNNFWGQPQMGDGGNPQINSVYWTIALEWQIYFLFPIIVSLWKRWGIWLTVLLFGCLLLVVHHVTVRKEWLGLNWTGFNFHFYFYFLLGVTAACLVFGPPSRTPRIHLPWLWIAPAMIWGFFLMYGLNCASLTFFSLLDLELWCALTTLAILVSASRGGLKFLSWPPLVAVGLFSYSVYLLHLPLVALVTDYLIVPLRPYVARPLLMVLLLVVSLPLILVFSRFFSRLFEDKKALARCWEALTRHFAAALSRNQSSRLP